MDWAKDDIASIARRQYTITTPLPLGGVLGLAIGGTIFAAFLAITAIYIARKKDRRKREKLKESDAEITREMSAPQREVRGLSHVSQRSSIMPFFPREQAFSATSNERLQDDSMMDASPMTNAQSRRLSQKRLFQIPRIRDSWPLTASIHNIPLRVIQPNLSMDKTSQAGGGGYRGPPTRPQWPGRTYSRNPKPKVIASAAKSYSQRVSTSELESAPKWPTHDRRSASVNQLSTILRSTSQRLKAAQRKSRSQALTNFGESMSLSPPDKLKTPCKDAIESQAGLVEAEGDDTKTMEASAIDSLGSSPGPTRKDVGNSAQSSMRHRSSITPSIESVDSLLLGTATEPIIPSALTSPSKKLRKSPQSQAVLISSTSSKELSTKTHAEGRESDLEIDIQSSPEEKAASTRSHRFSSTSDPFYAMVKSRKRAIPQNKIIGPRPYFMRQTTFGHEATLERPISFISTSSSPLQKISGNIQSSGSRVSSPISVASEPNTNPFDWEPEKKPGPSRTSSRRRGHKRSNVVRISVLSHPSHVSSLSEDPEEDSLPIKFKIPLTAPMRINGSAHSPTPSPRPSSTPGQRVSTRPPSISLFNPVLSMSTQGTMKSSLLGLNNGPRIYSPTFAILNYYVDERISEHEFFNAKPVESISESSNRHHLRQYHSTTAACPHPEHKELFSFPPLTLNTSSKDQMSLPPPRSSTVASSRTPTPPILLAAPQSLPAPPLLTPPSLSPVHLNGPRSEPAKRVSNTSLGPRDSLLHQSICMLRRMNSEVSRCSTASNEEEEIRGTSRSPARLSPTPSDWGRKIPLHSRGSQAYLSMGLSEQKKKRASKQQSGRRDKVLVKQIIKEDEDEKFVEWKRQDLGIRMEGNTESSDVGVKLVKQEEDSRQTCEQPTSRTDSERETSNEHPTWKDSLVPELFTPTSLSTGSNLKASRWSDATPSPSIRVNRHESQLLQPTAQSPPTWGWKKASLVQDEFESGEDVKENILNASPTSPVKGRSGPGRPNSLGLYDADGFLRSSPDRR